MNQKEIRELIEFLVEKDIAEFELERGDVKLHIKRGGNFASLPMTTPAPAAAPAQATAVSAMQAPPLAAEPAAKGAGAPAPARPVAEAAEEADLFAVKSPIVGTFYEAPSPGAPPFIKLGDTVKEGQVLCIIEAMKLMNEIEAEVGGVIAKIFVSNGTPVEYGMSLFGIRKQ